MAKVGNEVRLVLSLAKERMDIRANDYTDNPPNDFTRGYATAVRTYQEVLKNIVDNLERG